MRSFTTIGVMPKAFRMLDGPIPESFSDQRKRHFEKFELVFDSNCKDT